MMKNVMMTGTLLLMSAGIACAAPASSATPQSNRPIVLVSESQDVVHDETTGTVVHSTWGPCVRTKWMNPNDPCAPAEAAPPPPPPPLQISREERTVYFAFNEAALSPEMRQRLETLAYKLRSEQNVRGARIVGYADRIGNPAYNEKLSKKRAETVRQFLVSKGIINTSVADTRWVGAKDSVTNCPNDLKRTQLIECLQGDRRVEVEIDYYPAQAPQ
jgi:outer membrane protein OmpA-like peptidoglycan-associated protein